MGGREKGECTYMSVCIVSTNQMSEQLAATEEKRRRGERTQGGNHHVNEERKEREKGMDKVLTTRHTQTSNKRNERLLTSNPIHCSFLSPVNAPRLLDPTPRSPLAAAPPLWRAEAQKAPAACPGLRCSPPAPPPRRARGGCGRRANRPAPSGP